jgi:hypothetical protein
MQTIDSSAFSNLQEAAYTLVEVDRLARWDIYLRLQELAIPCKCKWGEPLRVQVDSAISALQLWCVVQSVTATKGSQINHLERCWAFS